MSLMELEQIYRNLHVERELDDPAHSRVALRDFLDQTTMGWYAEFCQNGFDEDLAQQLPDRWLACIFEFEEGLDVWFQAELFSWGQACLSDLTDQRLDGTAGRLIEHAFADMAAELPRQQLLTRRVHLQAKCKLQTSAGRT